VGEERDGEGEEGRRSESIRELFQSSEMVVQEVER
jgi:hypothetical protein